MIRDLSCPLCGGETQLVLQFRFGAKMNLPTDVPLRHCEADNFLFVAAGCQQDYDDWYKAQANDSYHNELSTAEGRSLFAIAQHEHLAAILGNIFAVPRKVLDFGCGQASLLLELALAAPSSEFWGFDPSPGAQVGAKKAADRGLANLRIADLLTIIEQAPYDLVVLSHVAEHLFDFDLLQLFHSLLKPDGLLYLEVPNGLQYVAYERQTFLYYLDRVHVNHFTPQSLLRLASKYGFGYERRFEYTFPYRDGGQYPGLGVLFRKDGEVREIASPSIGEAIRSYIAIEQERAQAMAAQWKAAAGLLVWGGGDNFYRLIGNGGPLCGMENIVVLDSNPRPIRAGNREYETLKPIEGIRKFQWPVIITVSEGRNALGEQVKAIDPDRDVIYL